MILRLYARLAVASPFEVIYVLTFAEASMLWRMFN